MWPDCRDVPELETADDWMRYSVENPMKLAYCANTLTRIINSYIEKAELLAPLWSLFPLSAGIGLMYLIRYMWAIWFVVQTEIESYFHIGEKEIVLNALF